MREIYVALITPDLPWLMAGAAIVIGGAHLLGCALARHYHWAWVEPPWTYVWGVGILLAFFLLHCAANNRLGAFVAMCLITAAAGSANMTAYWFVPRPPPPAQIAPTTTRQHERLAAIENASASLLEMDDMLAEWPAEKGDPILRAKLAEAMTHLRYARRPLPDIPADVPAPLIAELLRRRDNGQ